LTYKIPAQQQAVSVLHNHMTEEEFLSSLSLDDIYDVVIIAHGFKPYKREYYFQIETDWDDPQGGQYLLTFTHCYELRYEIAADVKILLQSWDDVFIDYEEHRKAGEPEGYVYGTNWSLAYPGFSLDKGSENGKRWSEKLNKSMQEATLETEIFKMNFVFHDWKITKTGDSNQLIKKVFFRLKG
jgi:hypothetical protein